MNAGRCWPPTAATVWTGWPSSFQPSSFRSLLPSGGGGWGAGVLSAHFGRVRVLELTVLWFAAFTFLSGFTHSYGQLVFTRAKQGFGFGGGWAVGSVLVWGTIEAVPGG